MTMSQCSKHARSTITIVCIGMMIVSCVGVATVAAGPPDVPASYYGQVLVDGDPAPEDVEIEATVDGEVRGTIMTDSNGEFGGPGAFDEKLTVTAETGDEVTFRIGDEQLETVDWESGVNEEIVLQTDALPESDDDDGESSTNGGSGSTGSPSDGADSGLDESEDDDFDSDVSEGGNDTDPDLDEPEVGNETESDSDEPEDNDDTGTESDKPEDSDDINLDEPEDSDTSAPSERVEDNDEEEDTGTANDDGQPGFGLVAALGAISTLVLWRFQ